MSVTVSFTQHAQRRALHRFSLSVADLEECWRQSRQLTDVEREFWKRKQTRPRRITQGSRLSRTKRLAYSDTYDVLLLIDDRNRTEDVVVTVYPLYRRNEGLTDTRIQPAEFEQVVRQLRKDGLNVSVSRNWNSTRTAKVRNDSGGHVVITTGWGQPGEISLQDADWRKQLSVRLQPPRSSLDLDRYRLSVLSHKQHVADFMFRFAARLVERMSGHPRETPQLPFVVAELADRARNHDSSKLLEPELSVFAAAQENKPTYGSEAYYTTLDNLGPALRHHYEHNRHHPEHHPRGVSDMDLLDVSEMLLDWWASTLETMSSDIYASIEHNVVRFEISPLVREYLLGTVYEMENGLRPSDNQSLLALLEMTLKKDRMAFSDSQITDIIINTRRSFNR